MIRRTSSSPQNKSGSTSDFIISFIGHTRGPPRGGGCNRYVLYPLHLILLKHGLILTQTIIYYVLFVLRLVEAAASGCRLPQSYIHHTQLPSTPITLVWQVKLFGVI